MTLRGGERMGVQIFVCDIPGFAGSAYAESVTLTDGVVHESLMGSHFAAVHRFDEAGCGRQVAHQEFPERPLADKANARAVALCMIGQRKLACAVAHIALQPLSQRKQRTRELRLTQPVEKVTLILAS